MNLYIPHIVVLIYEKCITQLDREKQQKETREYYTVWIIMMKKRYRSRREGEFVCPTSLPPGGYGPNKI